MNIKITKEQHEYLCSLYYNEYLFGSQLHGIATEESDYDYVRVISDNFYNNFTTLGRRLPNIHSWQYDGENNTQYVWMTEQQFYHNLFSGDGNMVSDIVLLSGVWGYSESLFLCRTYKIIKGYLGVAKRDLKMHGDNEKKRFHAQRSIMMAEMLMNNKKPIVQDIIDLKKSGVRSKESLFALESENRNILNSMLDSGDLEMYPNFKEENSLVKTMLIANNTREFRYDKK